MAGAPTPLADTQIRVAVGEGVEAKAESPSAVPNRAQATIRPQPRLLRHPPILRSPTHPPNNAAQLLEMCKSGKQRQRRWGADSLLLREAATYLSRPLRPMRERLHFHWQLVP